MDIDIDCKTNFDPKEIFDVTRASMVQNKKLTKHPCGVYFQNIPVDPITELSAIPYKEAEKLGFFKIDFLHLSVLDMFESKKEIRALLKRKPDWKILQDPDSIKKLMHLHSHYDLLSKVKPKSVEEIADCIALIRPGKRGLVKVYIKNRAEARRFLYVKGDNDAFSFKKSHAVAYALTIVLQMHLIKGKVI